MKLRSTELPGVMLVEPTVFGDDRGWFLESFNETRWHTALTEAGQALPRRFVQDNHSCSQSAVLRGLHYQLPPHAQGKLVRVVQGAAFDVAVDIRRGSPTFGRWSGHQLDAVNRLQLWIPEGFAHGFMALTDDTHFLYKTTDVYSRECERSIRWDDPQLAIQWPELGQALKLAPKDTAAPWLADADLPAWQNTAL